MSGEFFLRISLALVLCTSVVTQAMPVHADDDDDDDNNHRKGNAVFITPAPTPFPTAVPTSFPTLTPTLPPTVNTGEVSSTTNQNNTLVATSANQAAASTSSGASTTVLGEQNNVAAVKNPDINLGTVTTTINQENNIIIEAQPTPTPKPTPRIIPNNFVFVSISDGREHIAPGQPVTYRIIVTNPLNFDVNLNKIRVFIPQFVVPKVDEIDSRASLNAAARTIEWSNQVISAEGQEVYSVPAYIEPGAPGEHTLITSVDINGDGIHQSATDYTDIVAPGIVAAAQEVAPPISYVQPAVYAPAPVPVGVTATTGASAFSLFLAPLATILGSLGLKRYIVWG